MNWREFFKKAMKRRDAVEVVRCKDCIHWNKEVCPMHNSVFPGTTEECYCCFGERREGDDRYCQMRRL